MPRILVIDDNEDLCVALQAALELAGYGAAYEIEGERGLHRQRAEHFDLVVTDIFMPGQEGLETIRRLRNEFPDVKIVAMSGGGDLGIGGDYLEIATHFGAIKTLRKPFEAKALIDTIRALLAS